MPPLLRSLVAIMLGFMAIFVVRMIGNGIAIKLFGPGVSLGAAGGAKVQSLLAYNTGVLAVAALLGGAFTALLAEERKLRHGMIMATVLLLMSFLGASRSLASAQPLYLGLALLVGPVAAVLGAWLVERFAGSSPRL